MKSLFTKLAIALIILLAWVAYVNKDALYSFSFKNLKAMAPTELPIRLKPKISTTTTVYKWQDKSGKWHFSDTKPEGVANVTVEQIRSDQNVVLTQGGKTQKNSSTSVQTQNSKLDSESEKSSIFSPSYYKRAIDEAKAARDAMEARNQNLENGVK